VLAVQNKILTHVKNCIVCFLNIYALETRNLWLVLRRKLKPNVSLNMSISSSVKHSPGIR